MARYTYNKGLVTQTFDLLTDAEQAIKDTNNNIILSTTMWKNLILKWSSHWNN